MARPSRIDSPASGYEAPPADQTTSDTKTREDCSSKQFGVIIGTDRPGLPIN
jgi:hypothetical protein